MKSFFKVENMVFMLFFALSTALITFSTHREKELFNRAVKIVITSQLRLGQAVQGASDFFYGFGELITIKQKYYALEDEITYYRGIDRENVAVKNENARLRSLLAMTPRISYRYKSANIIARSPDNFQSTLVLDKGHADGIVKNMSVIAYNPKEALFGLVGRVSDVYEHSARVQPVFDKNQHVSARLERTRFLGLVSGEGRGSFASLNYLDLAASDELREGDLVVTSGLNIIGRDGIEYQSHYPEGLYIGRVEAVKGSKNIGTSLSVHLKSVIDFDRVENVFIITEQRAYQPSAQSVASGGAN